MQSNTISVAPIPQGTTTQKIRQIFHAFSVKNVHIDYPTAYVEFNDEGDLENLDIQFDNYEVSELNNAKIDKNNFDWKSVQNYNTSPDKKSDSNSSDKHQDLMAADIDNLVIVENCDEVVLNKLSEENVRELFHGFHSANRILKRKSDVVVEFTDAGEMEQLQIRFPGFNIPQLGKNSSIQKADPTKITAQEFVSEWSKHHTKESMLTQATTHLGYGDEKPSSGEIPRQNKFELGSFDSKASSQQVLHQDMIPPFDKKTSMEVNFLNEQSKLGFKEQKKQHEPIHEVPTHQQLDYTTELKIDEEHEEDKSALGYEAAEKQRKQQEDEGVQKERKEQEERQRKEAEERQKSKKEEEQKERQIKQEQQRQRQRKEQTERLRKRQEERQQRVRQEEDAARKRQQQQIRKREEEQRSRMEEGQAKKRRQAELIDKQLKEKLEIQRKKHQKEEEQKRQTQLGYHEMPTESQTVAKEAQFIKEAGKTIKQQLGYAVNKAKAQSANLVNAGLEILRGHETKPQEKIGYTSSTAEESFDAKKEEGKLGYQKPEIKEEKKKAEYLGYEKKQPKEAGLDLLNSSFEFLKGSYSKIQQTIGTLAKEVSNSSEPGYEKWTVKPDVDVQRPVVGKQPRVLKTLVTITLLIWVIFLLMQDTSQASDVLTHEVDIGLPTVESAQQETVS